MAVTVASRDLEGVVSAPAGARRIAVALVTFDSSYPTGGETLLASQVGLNQIDICLANAGLDGDVVTPIKQTDGSYKLKVWETYGTEVAATTDKSTLTVEVLCIGR